MSEPNIRTSATDPTTGVLWTVVAYKALNEAEMRLVVQQYQEENKDQAAPSAGQQVVITTTIGSPAHEVSQAWHINAAKRRANPGA